MNVGIVDEKTSRYRSARKAAIVAALVNLALAIGKTVAGFVGHSAAMVADGLHSASDLLADGVVFLSMRFGSRGPDKNHPYGHGRFETLAVQAIAILLVVVAFGIVVDAIQRLDDPSLEPPSLIALVAAVASILCKEALFWYTLSVGKSLNAKSLIASAWHHRSDAISSIAALVGIVGAILGWPVLDPIAAIVVALILGKVSMSLFYDSFKELSDSSDAVDKQIQREITRIVQDISEVRKIPFITSRRLGPDIVVDANIIVAPYLSVSEGHCVAEKVRHSLIDEIKDVTEVRVHVDTHEEHVAPSSPRESNHRNQLYSLIKHLIPECYPIIGVDDLVLHHTPDGIVLNICLKFDSRVSPAQALDASNDLCARLKEKDNAIADVGVTYSLSRAFKSDADDAGNGKARTSSNEPPSVLS